MDRVFFNLCEFLNRLCSCLFTRYLFKIHASFMVQWYLYILYITFAYTFIVAGTFAFQSTQVPGSLFCSVCGKYCTSSGNLKKHENWHHGIFQYTCPYCKKGYMASNTFKAHVSKHTGVNPLHCPVCREGFRYRQTLQHHIAVKHSMIAHVSKPSWTITYVSSCCTCDVVWTAICFDYVLLYPNSIMSCSKSSPLWCIAI